MARRPTRPVVRSKAALGTGTGVKAAIEICQLILLPGLSKLNCSCNKVKLPVNHKSERSPVVTPDFGYNVIGVDPVLSSVPENSEIFDPILYPNALNLSREIPVREERSGFHWDAPNVFS
jgi:hypothetical protein